MKKLTKIAVLLVAVVLASPASARGHHQVFHVETAPESVVVMTVIDVRAESAGDFDPNGDGEVDVADLFYLITYLFEDGPAPIGGGDANGDGDVDPADIFYLFNYLFYDGPAPLATGGEWDQ
jgi:Dockerin type I domain